MPAAIFINTLINIIMVSYRKYKSKLKPRPVIKGGVPVSPAALLPGPSRLAHAAFPGTLQGISNSARLEVLMPETGTGKAA